MNFDAESFSLLQLRVLRFGLQQDRNIRVRVLPEREKVLVGHLGLGDVALQHISATEAKMCKRTDGLVQDEAAMVEDLLELGSGFATPTRSQIGFATHKDWKHRGPIQINGSCRPKLVRRGSPKTLNGARRISFVERKLSADARQIIELHNCVFRKTLVQIVGQRFRSHVLPGVRKRERSKIL